MPQLFLKRCFRVIQVGNIYIYILWKSMNIFSLGVEWSTYLQCLAPKMVKWLDPYGSTVRYEVMKLFTLYRVSIEDSNGWYWISMSTPLLERRQCWGTTILPRAGYRLGTYRTVDIFNFSLISWTILEKKRFFVFLHYKINRSKGVFWAKTAIDFIL